MRQAQKKKGKDKVAVALMLAFCVIALTSIFTVKASIDKINNSQGLPVSETTSASKESENNVDNDESINSSNSLEEVSEASSKIPTIDSLDSADIKSEFVVPVNCDSYSVKNPYSMDKLIYSVTLDQYMTHCGVDIEAPEDTQVVAIASGTVTAIYNDDRYGTSIEISHGNNLLSIYSNLSTAEMVEIGDVVESGQVIGGVGSTGLFESLQASHLHFEMHKDGAYINPEDYVNF